MDPESFVRGGPYLPTFFLFFLFFEFDERNVQIPLMASSTRQGNAILMVFRWRADDGLTFTAEVVAL